ncbi:MAG TPA: DUF3187 family protein [Leptospiraceae bacterium]|nr:DUF3187 family protein [Leptospiraceae bacterium]
MIKFKKYIIFFTILLFLFIPKNIFSFMDYPYGVGFQMIQIPLLPIDNVNPGQGKFSMRVSGRLMNAFSLQTNRFIIDGEEGQIEPSLRYALSDYTQIGFSLPFMARGGGFLDHSIETFHRITGVTQGGRDHYPRNQFNISYEPLAQYYPLFDSTPLQAYLNRNFDQREYPRNSNDQPIQFSKQNDLIHNLVINKYYPYLNEYRTEDYINNFNSVARGNPKLFFQTTVLKGSFWFDKITIGNQVRFATKTSELIGTPGNDVSIFGIYHKDWFDGRVNWKLGVSYTRFEFAKYRNLDLRKDEWTIRPSLTYNMDENWKLHFEYVYFPSTILRFGRLSEPAHQIGIGTSYKYKDYQLQFALFENLITYSITPDIGFLLSIEKTTFN